MFNIFRKKRGIPAFRFQDSGDKICFTCNHVFHDGKDILLVTNDEDGDWQFMCGDGEHEMETGILICLRHATELDPTINDLWDLPLGYEAERKSKNAKWEVCKRQLD